MMFTSAVITGGPGAHISEDGVFRYTLWRVWDPQRPPFVVIGLNPSTADATKDDPTIRRCVGFAKREGCGRLVMLNLFAFRSPSPKALKAAKSPIGPWNEQALVDVLTEATEVPGHRVVAAWGNHGGLFGRNSRVAKVARDHGIILLCLGRTKQGHPGHPLYLPANTPLEVL